MGFRLSFLILSALIAASSAKVVEIHEEDWTDVLKGEWMIEL
jgi:hypothetical protein